MRAPIFGGRKHRHGTDLWFNFPVEIKQNAMLQNRVNPFGALIKTSERGTWLGNRGVIHNDAQEIVRPFKVKAWIICMLAFRGRHREVMQPGRWTELFFFDEATAYAAGHRPCFQCRYHEHHQFKEYWLKGNPQYGFNMQTPIVRIDDMLHGERIAPDGSKVVYTDDIKTLPEGTFISYDGHARLVANGMMHVWSPGGYTDALPLPDAEAVTVLTPRSIVQAFRAGYMPQMGV
jgi:hypothetical protein